MICYVLFNLISNDQISIFISMYVFRTSENQKFYFTPKTCRALLLVKFEYFLAPSPSPF